MRVLYMSRVACRISVSFQLRTTLVPWTERAEDSRYFGTHSDAKPCQSLSYICCVFLSASTLLSERSWQVMQPRCFPGHFVLRLGPFLHLYCGLLVLRSVATRQTSTLGGTLGARFFARVKGKTKTTQANTRESKHQAKESR